MSWGNLNRILQEKGEKTEPKMISSAEMFLYVQQLSDSVEISLGVKDRRCFLALLARVLNIPCESYNHYVWSVDNHGVEVPVMFVDCANDWCAFYKKVTPFIGTGYQLKKELLEFLAKRKVCFPSLSHSC